MPNHCFQLCAILIWKKQIPIQYPTLTIMGFPDFMSKSGVIENPFGGSGLTGVNMGDDPDVSKVIQH